MIAENSNFKTLLMVLVLSAMAAPAYAGSKKIVTTDLYGDGSVMIASLSSDAKKKLTVGEAMDRLAPLPEEARNMSAEQRADGTIVIRSEVAVHKSAPAVQIAKN